MAEGKYGKYVIKRPMAPSKNHPHLPLHVHLRKETMPWDDRDEIEFGFAMHCIQEPLLMLTEPHVHEDFPQFLFFLSGNPKDPDEFDAEVEMYLGKDDDQEKFVITEPTIIRVPPGVWHGPLNWKRIGKPVQFIDISLAPGYDRIQLSQQKKG